MDSTVVVCVATWILAEMIRFYHNISISDAQKYVDSLIQYPVPWVWESDGKCRVLTTDLSFKDQVLILLASKQKEIEIDLLKEWVECKTKTYLYKILRALHKKRYLEFDSKKRSVQILPPGAKYVSSLIGKTLV
jgi:hypothetical protein